MGRRAFLGASSASLVLAVAPTPVFSLQPSTSQDKDLGISDEVFAVERVVALLRQHQYGMLAPHDYAIICPAHNRRYVCIYLPQELREKLEYDIKENQFMVTGTLTRSLYDESCTFTDEIDTYTLDKWIQGTGLLFKNDYSKVTPKTLSIACCSSWCARACCVTTTQLVALLHSQSGLGAGTR